MITLPTHLMLVWFRGRTNNFDARRAARLTLPRKRQELPTQFGETAAANVGNLTWKNEFVTQMDQVAYRSRQMTPRDDANQLRTRGTRMLELATRAYCEQHHDFARLLTQLATEVFAHARNVEESDALYAARPLRKLPGERRR